MLNPFLWPEILLGVLFPEHWKMLFPCPQDSLLPTMSYLLLCLPMPWYRPSVFSLQPNY